MLHMRAGVPLTEQYLHLVMPATGPFSLSTRDDDNFVILHAYCTLHFPLFHEQVIAAFFPGSLVFVHEQAIAASCLGSFLREQAIAASFP